MSLDAGSVKGSFVLETDEYTNNLLNVIGVTKQAENEVSSSFDKMSKEVEGAGTKEEELGKKSITLEEQLKSLAESAGAATAFKALTSAVTESISAFGYAEKVSDRLKIALDMRGLSDNFPVIAKLAGDMQDLTGMSDETFQQIAAEMIAQGKSIADVQKMISASAAYASISGQDLMSTYQQLNGTYTGNVGRLNKLIPALSNLTEEQLKNGAAIDFINEQYGGFTGKVGETEIAINSTKQLIGDFSEMIGSTMKPVILLVTEAISGLIKILLQAPKPLKEIFGIITTVGIAALGALAIRTAVVTAAKWGLFGAQMAVNAANAVGNPLLWAGIAAASALVIAIGALIASKVKEANAIKEAQASQEEHTRATRDATSAMNAQKKATEEYMQKLDGLSDKELETTKTTLIALAGRTTGAMRAYYEERLAMVNKEIKSRELEKQEEKRREAAQAAAQAYENEMNKVRQAIEAAKTEEQKLVEQIEIIKNIKTKNAKDEEERIKALAILEEKLAEVRARSAEAMTQNIDVHDEKSEEQVKKLKTLQEANEEYFNAIKNSASETFDFIGKAGEATIDGLTNTLLSSIKELSSMSTSLQLQEFNNQKALLEKNYKERKSALDEQLKNELITQEEYDTALAALDEDKKQRSNELAKTQFENKKAASIAGVWIDAAGAILGWWKAATELGPIAGPIFGGAMTAVTLGYAGLYSSKIAQEEFVPAYATGGKTKEGYAQINEKGGEIVWLPDGTLVIPNDISNRIAENTNTKENITINITGNYIKDKVDVNEIANIIIQKLNRNYRGVL